MALSCLTSLTWITPNHQFGIRQERLPALLWTDGSQLRTVLLDMANDSLLPTNVPLDPDSMSARELVLRAGWNSTCYQLLNPGLKYWFSHERDAVVGYVHHVRTWVIAGAPVCTYERLPAVIDSLEREAAAQRSTTCYFASESRLESCITRKPNYAVLLLGGQPVWHPARLVSNFEHKSSLRTQLHRARNKSVVVEEWSSARATDSPELHRVLQEWLATRGLPSLHFLVEPQTLGFVEDRRIFVAMKETEVIGFVTLSPIPERNGWLVEQFVRGTAAVNGTIELLLYHAARAVAADGAEYVTLGLSPLSAHAGGQIEGTPPLIRAALAWVRAHGTRFYNFKGLENFKTKFEPEYWEPIYAILNKPRFTLRALYAIASAFTAGRPILAFLVGLVRAARQEVQWLAGNKS